MKIVISTPKIIKCQEKFVFNIIDYYTLLNSLKDSTIIIHDKSTIALLRNYLFNLDSIEQEIINLRENSNNVSLLKIKTEVVQNHIIFLTSYIKAKLCNKGLINENNERTCGFEKIDPIVYIEELLDNAFEWLEFVQYSSSINAKLIYKKYSELLSLNAFDYYCLTKQEIKAKESLNFSIKNTNSEKCKKSLENYIDSLESIKYCENIIKKIDKKV